MGKAKPQRVGDAIATLRRALNALEAGEHGKSTEKMTYQDLLEVVGEKWDEVCEE
jgi:hypothetical protein